MDIKQHLMDMVKPNLLTDIASKLLNFTLMGTKPPSPIIEVNDNEIKIELNRLMIRHWGLPALFSTFIFLGYNYTNDFYQSWKGSERGTLSYIEYRKKKYGDDYFQTTKNKVAVNRYKKIGDDLVLSFEEYLNNYRYNPERRGGSELGFDIFRISFLLLGLFVSVYFFIRFKRLAPLVIDREKKLLYTWRGGRVLAQRYDDMQYLGNIQGLFVPLGVIPNRKRWGEKIISKDSVGWYPFRIMPDGNLYVNDMEKYEAILAYIVQFMEYGRDHVIPDQASWKSDKKDYLFYEDKKPVDFDEQLAEVLRRLESNREAWLKDLK